MIGSTLFFSEEEEKGEIKISYLPTNVFLFSMLAET